MRVIYITILIVLSFAIDSSSAAELTRGPYLQRVSDSGLVVRWRTLTGEPSTLCYGNEPDTLPNCITIPEDVTEHRIELSGLNASTRYYYSVGSGPNVLAGANTEYYFETAPLPGTVIPTRIWVLGDSGTAGVQAAAVRDGFLAFSAGRVPDSILMLGDNAYYSGTDAEYQRAVFDMYQSILRKTVVWPVLGNHDAVSSDSITQTGPYFSNFSLPRFGQAGGYPSGTEAYYSFDHGHVHFIVLDSNSSDRTSSGPMLTWLVQDLRQTKSKWIIAGWHHPPYTHGSHNSDLPTDSADRMGEMRRNVLPILEQYGVDLVLSGHSHSYERSFLLDGHYGLSSTLIQENILNSGDGLVSGSYRKPAGIKPAHKGAVYAVVGSSGQISGGSLDHPAMYINKNILGSMVIDVSGTRLEGIFIDTAGNIQDRFQIVKSRNIAPQLINLLF